MLCRSVSGLHSISGVDDQLILVKLLPDESDSYLQTRGPYNSVFKRKSSGANGFSIDRPMSLRTMLLSGLIMILIQAHHGKFLACLNLCKGTDYNIVLRENRSTNKKELIVSDSIKWGYATAHCPPSDSFEGDRRNYMGAHCWGLRAIRMLIHVDFWLLLNGFAVSVEAQK